MSQSIHQFSVNDINGEEVSLSEYEGKVVMVVNTASKCGFTPQLGDMEDLYKEYREKGFEILAFPSNDFMGQEPLEGEDIKQFCMLEYNASYPIFDKVHVKGSKATELYQFLSDKSKNGKLNSTPKWNFHKYLINKNGEVVDSFLMTTKPTSRKVKKAIDRLLEE